ncbi:MAG: carbohydrate binding domain-containing protein [Ignavibacteria bacterium]|nr:carbohydrate binding domain-containing protein [Ignavibacteria bacterium]
MKIVKNLFRLILLAFILTSYCFPQENKNLLLNGNFEQGITYDSIPEGWKWDTGYKEYSNCRVREENGNKILYLENTKLPPDKFSMFTQKINGIKSCELEFRAKFKAGFSDSVEFFIRCNDSSNNPVAFGTQKFAGNNSWREISFKFNVPHDTKNVVVMNLFIGIGKAYFDDLDLRITKQFKTGKTNIVVLGCEHSSELINPKMFPAVFRAFFNRLKPDAVCLETKSEWLADKKFFPASYESWGITYPWAVKNNVPVFGVDWQPDIKASERYWTKMDFDKRKREIPSSDSNGLEYNPENDLFFADIDTFYFNRYWLGNISNPAPEGRWSDEGFRRYMLFRDMIIAQNILDVAVNFQCGTVLVVYGAAHKAGLEYYLKKYFSDNVNIIKPSEYGYPSADEIEKETLKEDELAVCYFLMNDNNWIADKNLFPFGRIDSILSKYEKSTKVDIELKYLRGRYYLLKNDTANYLALLNGIIKSGADKIKSYPKPELFFTEEPDASSIFYNNAFANQVVEGYDFLTVRQLVLYELSEYFRNKGNKPEREEILSLLKNEKNVHPKAKLAIEFLQQLK